MAVRVVTDSTSDLPPGLARELGITVVPLRVQFGEESYLDGVELGADEFYSRLARDPALPRTSQPSAGDFARVYAELAREAEGILSLHISSRLSGTHNSALQGREALEGIGCPIQVLDSLQVSLGLGLVALAAARAAREGASLDKVAQVARSTIPRVKVLCLVDTLEYLQKGGRIGSAQAFLGSLLRVKPLLSIQDGEVHPLERARTKARALERLEALIAAYDNIEEMGIVYSTGREEAEALARSLEARLPRERILMGRFGPVLGTYVGPGALGVALVEAQA